MPNPHISTSLVARSLDKDSKNFRVIEELTKKELAPKVNTDEPRNRGWEGTWVLASSTGRIADVLANGELVEFQHAIEQHGRGHALPVQRLFKLTTFDVKGFGAGGDQTITSYHAAVVLDLSWMNNTSTWIWFILYVHYRSKRDEEPTGAKWSKWRDALLEPLWELLGRTKRASASTPETSIVERIRRIPQHIRHIPQRIRCITWQHIWRIPKRIWHFISEQPVLTLGSIHLSLMAAVGIWLWSDPSKFGQALNPNCDPTLTVIGVPARFSSKPLRIVSLIMYSIVLIPDLNLIPPFVFFLALHIWYNWSREQHKSFWTRWDSILKVLTPRKSSPSLDAEKAGHSQRSSTAVSSGIAQPETSDSSPNTALPSSSIPAVSEAGTSGPFPHTAFLIVGLVSLVAINILFIVDIELTLRRNRGDQNGDAQWGFGQVLALLLLIIPLRDAWGALQDIREKLKGIQEQFNEILRCECLATSVQVVEELGRLVKNGADPTATVDLAGTTFDNSSQLVTCYGKTELVQFLRKSVNGGDEAVPGVDYSKVLQSAAASGHALVVKALLRLNEVDYIKVLQFASASGHVLAVKTLLGVQEFIQRLNEVGGDYGTALCAACASGKVEVVNALLQAGARRNRDDAQLELGKHFGAPLHVAILVENREMVELLIGNEAKNADCICE
ncbi:hypothetical protein B0H16DRAFT_1469965 [Mycena metata]|uniref:Uncharacterized protein n=1 Tax=Mycena metata TaxID=1033252 RepID=A0AAD7MS63_9AGAR|nr:hypothetical protein B0H16DRAFT_1469965 [Mycena metata]